jgi:hypothetical protein
MLVLFYDTNGVPQPVNVTDGSVNVKIIGDEDIGGSTTVIDFAHAEIHEGDSFTAYYTRITAETNAHRSGLFIKTGTKQVHIIVSFACSAAANYSICEAPTIASNTGTHAGVIYNRYRDNIKISSCFDNATVPAVNKYTTLTEVQFAGDVTWATGTVIRSAPLSIGVEKPAGGVTRDSQEYILKANTKYVFLLTNTIAALNTHHIFIDWYEI